MRKFLISMLAASVLTPAAAVAEDGGLLGAIRSGVERKQRDGSSDSRPDRAQLPQRTERSSADDHSHGAQHSDNHSTGSHREYHRDARQDHRDFHATDPTRREHRQYHREAERDHRSDHRSWDRNRNRGSHGDYHDDLRQEHADLHASDPSSREHRSWHRNAERQHDRRHDAWSTDWRRDSRYNWYDYRSRYSSLYNLGRYYDPYGWGYRRWSIGFTLWPSYYGSNYWLNDPWRYRLPPAYGPYRWVRYYDDALLVNIYTGQVVDVIYNFFW
ncbi:MAG TPA: RcnB family protein [Sphingomicrobium sp.]|nr:RcnB family protein [Sphingomicrobium sp.]